MKLTKSGFKWLKAVVKELSKDELRTLCRTALDVARERKASTVGRIHLETAWTRMNGGE